MTIGEDWLRVLDIHDVRGSLWDLVLENEVRRPGD